MTAFGAYSLICFTFDRYSNSSQINHFSTCIISFTPHTYCLQITLTIQLTKKCTLSCSIVLKASINKWILTRVRKYFQIYWHLNCNIAFQKVPLKVNDIFQFSRNTKAKLRCLLLGQVFTRTRFYQVSESGATFLLEKIHTMATLKQNMIIELQFVEDLI